MQAMTRRAAVGVLAAMCLAPLARADDATIPVRVRIMRGSRQGPPQLDPRLADVQHQLSQLAYVRWEQVSEQDFAMAFGKTVQVPLPDGSEVKLTLVESRKDTVTFRVGLPSHKTHSLLTISKDKRIVHQVSDEKAGVAYFATVRPWP